MTLQLCMCVGEWLRVHMFHVERTHCFLYKNTPSILYLEKAMFFNSFIARQKRLFNQESFF